MAGYPFFARFLRRALLFYPFAKIIRKDRKKMKKIIKVTVSLILAVTFMLSLVACNTVEKTGLWENAVHRRDMEFGKGATTIVVEVEVEKQKVTFTVNTDKEKLDEALLEHELIKTETGPYGAYITHVNGILASDDDRAYWSLYINGEYAMTGASDTPVTAGTVYKLEYATY